MFVLSFRYPSVMTMADGNILIVGGGQQVLLCVMCLVTTIVPAAQTTCTDQLHRTNGLGNSPVHVLCLLCILQERNAIHGKRCESHYFCFGSNSDGYTDVHTSSGSMLAIHDCSIVVTPQEIGGWSVSDAATSKSGAYESDMLMGKCVPNGGGGAGDPYWDNPYAFSFFRLILLPFFVVTVISMTGCMQRAFMLIALNPASF